MSEELPMNDLDRAVMAATRSQSAMPEFCRRLVEGELCFLIPYHPEVPLGKVRTRETMNLPPLEVQGREAPEVAVFSSPQRADEGAQKFAKGQKLITVKGSGRSVLESLGKSKKWACVNPGCATGSLSIPPEMMLAVADGSLLQPRSIPAMGPTNFTTLDPATYPTKIIQPAFEFMRRYPNFRAAWLFGKDPTPEMPKGYHMMVLMEPRDPQILHELILVVELAQEGVRTVNVACMRGDAAQVAENFRMAVPFYRAPDYDRPVDPQA